MMAAEGFSPLMRRVLTFLLGAVEGITRQSQMEKMMPLGDGGGCQPPGYSHLGVETGDPVRPTQVPAAALAVKVLSLRPGPVSLQDLLVIFVTTVVTILQRIQRLPGSCLES